MENESEGRDWFSQGWEETGGIVADGRETEELPEDAREEESGGVTEDMPENRDTESGGEPEGTEETQIPVPAPGMGGTREDFARFVTEFPDVEPGDIPREVWDRVRAGESLSYAWARHQARVLREENRMLRQGERNRQRSAGSQRGVGAGPGTRDAFEEGWESAVM